MPDPYPGQYLVRQVSPVYTTNSMAEPGGSISAVTVRYIGRDQDGNLQQYYAVNYQSDPNNLPKPGNIDPGFYAEYSLDQLKSDLSSGLAISALTNLSNGLSNIAAGVSDAIELYKSLSNSGYLPDQYQRGAENLPTINDLSMAGTPLNTFIPVDPSDATLPAEVMNPNYNPGFSSGITDPQLPDRIPGQRGDLEDSNGSSTIVFSDNDGTNGSIVLPEINVVGSLSVTNNNGTLSAILSNSNIAYTTLTAQDGAKFENVYQDGNYSGDDTSFTIAPSLNNNIFGSNDVISVTSNSGTNLGVFGQYETLIGDNGSNSVNLGGANTYATVYGGGYVGLIDNNQTLTLGDSGSTVATAPDVRGENIIGTSANITFSVNATGNVSGSGDTINLQGNSSDQIAVFGQNQVVTGDSGSNSVNLGGDGTSATVYGGGYVGLVYSDQSVILADQGSSVLTAPGVQNESVTANGSTISLAAGALVNIGGNNNTIHLEGNNNESIGVSGQGLAIDGDSGNDAVNLNANTSATVSGGGTIGLFGENIAVTADASQQFTIIGGDGATNDTIHAMNSTIDLPSGWDGSIYGMGLEINLVPNSGSNVTIYGYDDAFTGSQGDQIQADAYDPSNLDDPYAPYQPGDPDPGEPYDPGDPDPGGDPGDPGDPFGDRAVSPRSAAASPGSQPAAQTQQASTDTSAHQLIAAMASFAPSGSVDTTTLTPANTTQPTVTTDPNLSHSSRLAA